MTEVVVDHAEGGDGAADLRILHLVEGRPDVRKKGVFAHSPSVPR